MKLLRCVNCMKELDHAVCDHCGYDNQNPQQNPYGLRLNTILRGRYLVGNIIGQGGFGITYVGMDLVLDLKVAIKEYYPMGQVSRDHSVSNELLWNTHMVTKDDWEKGCDSFLKEARKMARVDDVSSVVRVKDTFYENRTAYIVMEFVEGIDLKTWLKQNGVMSYTQCAERLKPLLAGLSKVHKAGLIHRDISPDNIMVRPDGSLCLLDLGAAKDMRSQQNGKSMLVTKKGFSPPEQYLEGGSIGTWTDVYAMCATMYYCITGKLIPDAMDRMWKDQLTFDVPVKESLKEAQLFILKRGLELHIEDRIKDFDELLTLLSEDVSITGQNDKDEKQVSVKDDKEEKKEEAKRKKEEQKQKQEELRKQKEVAHKQKQSKQKKEEKSRKERKPLSKRAKLLIGAIAGCICLIGIGFLAVSPNLVWKYEELEDGIRLTYYGGDEVSVEIPKSLWGKDVVSVDPYLFANLELEEITVAPDHEYLSAQDGVLFNQDMSELLIYPSFKSGIEYNVPDGVISIGTAAFRDTNYLELVVLPEGVESIGESAFFASHIREITIPDTVTWIDENAFAYSRLKKVDNLGRIESIESRVFYNCNHLQEVHIPKSVREIKSEAFASCWYLTSITVDERCAVYDNDIEINYYYPNVLQSDSNYNDKVFDSKYNRSEIKSVNFVDGLYYIPQEAESVWDVSEKQDETVMAWVIKDVNKNGTLAPYDLYIGADGIIEAIYGVKLFAGYVNVESINFNGCFYTRRLYSMYEMFADCSKLTSLDCSDFDTSKVTDLSGMFLNCASLDTLDLDNFKTGSVETMSHMFEGCSSLESLDLDHFSIHNVESMFYMFEGCENLTELNIPSWELYHVKYTKDMFKNTPIEEEYSKKLLN